MYDTNSGRAHTNNTQSIDTRQASHPCANHLTPETLNFYTDWTVPSSFIYSPVVMPPVSPLSLQ